jgi:co-chaperonin GroES (HSP10)
MRGDELARGGKRATFYPSRELKEPTDDDLIGIREIIRPIEDEIGSMAISRDTYPGQRKRYRATPVGDELLVEPVSKEHDSTFIIPDSAKGKTNTGYAVACGPDVKRCAQGNLVLFDVFAAHGKEIDVVDEQGIDRKRLLLKDYDILAVLEIVED